MTEAAVPPPSLRPAEAYLYGARGLEVRVTGRAAAWLLRNTNLNRRRAAARGADCEVDAVLVALATAGNSWAASAHGSSCGSGVVREAEVTGPLVVMSTGQAAEALGVTDRAVRLACEQGRLRAEQVNGRWRIARNDLETYRAARAA